MLTLCIVVLSRIHLPLRLECAEIVYSGVFKDVNDKVKSVVLSDSETIETDNSLKNDNVETLIVVQNDSDTVETFNSGKTGNFIEQKRHCN